MLRCAKCEKKIDPNSEVTVTIRIEYPQGPTFGKKWCFACYKKGRDEHESH